MSKLNIFYEGKFVGTLSEDEEERLEFIYSDMWINNSDSFSLSLALKVKKKIYGHIDAKSFFENLLPEGEVKKILEKTEHENIQDEFNFLKKYGVDCAGAFVITEAGSIPKILKFKNKEISTDIIYKYLDEKQSLTSAMIYDEGGRFSLAGAQDKFPIIYKKNKMYLPLNGEPTTHILKPHVLYHKDTLDSPYNEYFCMKLAKTVGLNVPKVYLIDGKYPLYLVERFDRHQVDGKTMRIHQQDFCQAQGITSKKKYEDEGGPTIIANYNLIKDNSVVPVKDLQQFLKWLWFNLFIGNHDCHSKNLSFLSSLEGLRLSPFYDLLCTTIYKGLTNKFSYSIGKQFKWFDLKERNIEALAEKLGINFKVLFAEGRDVIAKLSLELNEEISKFEEEFPKVKTAREISKEIYKRVDHLKNNITNLN